MPRLIVIHRVVQSLRTLSSEADGSRIEELQSNTIRGDFRQSFLYFDLASASSDALRSSLQQGDVADLDVFRVRISNNQAVHARFKNIRIFSVTPKSL